MLMGLIELSVYFFFIIVSDYQKQQQQQQRRATEVNRNAKEKGLGINNGRGTGGKERGICTKCRSGRTNEDEERREGTAGKDDQRRVWDLLVLVDPKDERERKRAASRNVGLDFMHEFVREEKKQKRRKQTKRGCLFVMLHNECICYPLCQILFLVFTSLSFCSLSSQQPMLSFLCCCL